MDANSLYTYRNIHSLDVNALEYRLLSALPNGYWGKGAGA